MKKLSFLLVFIFAVMTATEAQHVFNKGDLMFNAGIGIPHNYGFIPTLNASGEFGAIPTGDVGLVSFGGLAEFQLGQHNDFYYGSEAFPRFYVGARAAWHVHAFQSDVFDAYGGVGFGIAISGKSDYYGSFSSVEPDIFVGGRWMFAEKMGLFAELGYTGLSSVKFGLTFGL